MNALNYDSKYGRYFIEVTLESWCIDPSFWSGYDKPLSSLVSARRSAAHRELDDILDGVVKQLKEINLIKEEETCF